MLSSMPVTDDIQRVAAAIERPRAGYVKRLDEAREMIAPRSVEALRQLEVFLDRVDGLTAGELRELYTETFRGEAVAVRRLLGRLARTPMDGAGACTAVSALAPLLERLDTERNPFAHVVRALCCLLLGRAKSPQLEASRGS